MASRAISAILWTLVSVNILTLVVGGLITWLGYAIPIRLKQFGLLPELVIVVGFASLVVACIGLCALNYSSHYTLNVYAVSCSLFVLMLVLGIPEAWYKSDQFSSDNLPMNIIYFALLILLLVLMAFAFIFANYLRRRELQDNPEQTHSDHLEQQQRLQHYHHNITTTSNNNNSNNNNNPIGANLFSALGPSVLASTCTCAASKSALLMDGRANNGVQASGHPIRARDKWQPDIFSSNSTYNTLQHQHHHRHRSNDFCATFGDSATHTQSSATSNQRQFASKHDKTANYEEPHNKNSPEVDQLPTLTSKGFYRHISSADERPSRPRDANIMRTNSCRRPLNDIESCVISSRRPDCSWQDDKLSRSQPVIAPTLRGSWDDTVIEYGEKAGPNSLATDRVTDALLREGQYRSSTLGRCRCLQGLASNGLSLAAKLNSSHSMMNRTQRPLKLDSSVLYSMPADMTSNYFMARKGRHHKPMASKSSSSVMAMTAAAAAALLGGVTDTSSLMQPDNNFTYGDMFSAPGQELLEHDLGGDCAGFDQPDQHLDASMFDVPYASEAFHQSSVCRKPVLDFATLLDIRK